MDLLGESLHSIMPPLIQTLALAVKMSQWVKTLTKSDDLSMIPGTHRVEGEGAGVGWVAGAVGLVGASLPCRSAPRLGAAGAESGEGAEEEVRRVEEVAPQMDSPWLEGQAGTPTGL